MGKRQNKMADIAANISSLKSLIPSSVKLVAVSKTKPVSDILEAYNAGQRMFRRKQGSGDS